MFAISVCGFGIPAMGKSVGYGPASWVDSEYTPEERVKRTVSIRGERAE
jgi:hypothetical protein